MRIRCEHDYEDKGHEVLIRNIGLVTVPKGTLIDYELDTGLTGTVSLAQNLPPEYHTVYVLGGHSFESCTATLRL